MTTLRKPPDEAPPPSHVEEVKIASDGLGGALFGEIDDAALDHLSEDVTHVLKFHGSYQQDDRDLRKSRKLGKHDRAWEFMVRTKFPGGRLTAEQYLLADELAGRFGNGTLRITSRQDFQFHGVGKARLKPLISALNERWITTYGGCGDVGRNTVSCPVADLLPGSTFDVQALAREVSAKLMPASTAYYELWLDGERVHEDGTREQVTPSRTEPLYGPTYMPRKHKTAIGLPHDNCVDVLTHDLALEAVLDERGRLSGFNLLAGGGLGSTHGNAATFPRLADRIGFLEPELALAALEAATRVYRDSGDRSNRKHARLKYVLAERGVGWFRGRVEEELGRPLASPAPVPRYRVEDHLGWHLQADGRWLLGLHVDSGRIRDGDGRPLRQALRTLVERFQPELRLTPQQNVVLANLEQKDRAEIERLLARHEVSPEPPRMPLRRFALACPALPTCGLAVAEAERVLPQLLRELERLGHGNDHVSLRISGCPNACSRPPTAEVGIVGRSLVLYSVYLGGSFEGTRLARLWRDDVPLATLPAVLSEVLTRWRQERREAEPFGDWAIRSLFPAAGG
jgi:sulfite reductase (ferredoxin)